MAQGAAIVLALSLIVAGLAIMGDALGWFVIPGDLWAAVIVLLGTAGRFVSSRRRGPNGLELPAAANPPEASKPNGSPPPPGMAILLMGLVPALVYCSAPQARADAIAWARCAGGGALACAPAAADEDHTAGAINYAACVSARAIACVGPLVARENPPSPSSVKASVDLGCVQDTAATCSEEARRDHARIGRHQSGACIEAEILECYRDGETEP